jgi:Bacterial SH3 domain
MKKKGWVILLGLLIMTSGAMAETAKVITQEAIIRKDKRFFAPIVIRVPYGEAIEELGRQGDWLRVSYGGKQGWIHISAVQEQKFQLSSFSTEKASEASHEEVALAGKGFTPEVEKAFRDKNPKMRYDLVDQIQYVRIEDVQLQAFIRTGNLKEPGGEP